MDQKFAKLVETLAPKLERLGTDARPNWNEMHKREPITRASESPLLLQ